jgi:hypothetical protein
MDELLELFVHRKDYCYHDKKGTLPQSLLDVIDITNEVSVAELWPRMSRYSVVDVTIPNVAAYTA